MAATVGPNCWLDSPPKISNRPTIDGRRKDVCESLKEQTMSMARANRPKIVCKS